MSSQRAPALKQRLAQAKITVDKIKESKEIDSLNSNFRDIENGLQHIESILPQVENWEETLMIQFLSLEKTLEKVLLEAQNKVINLDAKLKNAADDIIHIKKLISPMQQAPAVPSTSGVTNLVKPRSINITEDVPEKMYSEQWLRLGMEKRIRKSPTVENLWESYDHLSSLQLKLCLLYFSLFPENALVKKRPLIYWWIGESLITKTADKTSEEVGEEIFQKLITEGLIEPYPDRRNPVVNACTVQPWIRRMLISVALETKFFKFDSEGMPSGGLTYYLRACLVLQNRAELVAEELEKVLTVFNVNEKYLNFKPEWLKKMKKIEVFQLGRWEDLPTHHIEVQNAAFLKDLGVLTRLKYLSLRGISRITELPPSVSELVSLKILDLRACHNLEKLPADIVTMRKLTHLDLSECYLLESMPKGLEKLNSLQALKGFVVGSGSRKTSSRIDDLAALRKLRRLSIYISSKAVIQDGEFNKLKEIVSLRCLTISWGVTSLQQVQESLMNSISFPPKLEKLDLRGIPQEKPREWLNPNKLENLKKLYIRGRKLSSLDNKSNKKWKVEILRLKYLKKLDDLKLGELQTKFPQLIYLEIVKGDPNNTIWSKNEDMTTAKK